MHDPVSPRDATRRALEQGGVISLVRRHRH